LKFIGKIGDSLNDRERERERERENGVLNIAMARVQPTLGNRIQNKWCCEVFF
jgi:hypothetical protein